MASLVLGGLVDSPFSGLPSTFGRQNFRVLGSSLTYEFTMDKPSIPERAASETYMALNGSERQQDTYDAGAHDHHQAVTAYPNGTTRKVASGGSVSPAKPRRGVKGVR